MDILRQITISEVILVFNLLFVLPVMAFLLWRLRKYETQFGQLPMPGLKRKRKEKKEEPRPEAPDESKTDLGDVYPYRSRIFLSPSEKACLTALEVALGPEVMVFPKVALWETVESSDPEPGYRERLLGKNYDFLVCDRRTGKPLTGIMFKPGKGRPAGPIDELKKVCAAAGANLVFINQAEEYDAAGLKSQLGIPDIEL